MKSMWIFALLIVSVYGGRTPSISWITKEKVVDIGATITLECSVQYAEDYPVLWVKKGVDGSQDLPISSNSGLIVRDPRYALNIDKDSSTYILEIRQLQENDGGEYMCQVLISLVDRISASVPLLVRRPPIISDNSTRSVVVSEGAMVNLECYAGGVPIPKVSWRRENNAILPTGGSVFSGNRLKVKSIKKEDRGTYYCIAENGVGRGARRNINVEVEFRPMVTITKPVVYQALLFDAIMECRVEAYPPAAISWVYEHDTLVNNQHYVMSQFATADEFTDTTLRVKTIEKRQYGNYTCRGDNKFGGSTSQVVLIESIHVHNIGDAKTRHADEKDLQDSKNNQQDSKNNQQDSKKDQQDSKKDQQDSKMDQQDSKNDQQDSKNDQQDSKNDQQDSKNDHQDSKNDQQNSTNDQKDTCAICRRFVKEFASHKGRTMEYHLGNIIDALVVTVNDLKEENTEINHKLSNVTLRLTNLEEQNNILRKLIAQKVDIVDEVDRRPQDV